MAFTLVIHDTVFDEEIPILASAGEVPAVEDFVAREVAPDRRRTWRVMSRTFSFGAEGTVISVEGEPILGADEEPTPLFDER